VRPATPTGLPTTCSRSTSSAPQPEIQRPGTVPPAPVRTGEGTGDEAQGIDGAAPTTATAPRRLSDLTVREGIEALEMTRRLETTWRVIWDSCSTRRPHG
jgi:hypothetical protein